MKFEQLEIGQLLFAQEPDPYAPDPTQLYDHFYFVMKKSGNQVTIFEISSGDAYGEWFWINHTVGKEMWKDSWTDAELTNKKKFFDRLWKEIKWLERMP